MQEAKQRRVDGQTSKTDRLKMLWEQEKEILDNRLNSSLPCPHGSRGGGKRNTSIVFMRSPTTCFARAVCSQAWLHTPYLTPLGLSTPLELKVHRNTRRPGSGVGLPGGEDGSQSI